MARLFVQLKLRILVNALRSSVRGKTSFVISTTVAVLVAAGTFAVLALLRGQAAPVELTTVIFTLFGFGWLILPLLAFGLDSTLDPATLSMYPLRTRPLAVGLLAASATGAWPAANVIGLLGVTIGLARGGPGELVAVVAVLLQVLFSIVLARFVITGLAGVLRSRRGKDFAVFLFIPIVACYELFTQVVPQAGRQRSADRGQLRGHRPVAALAAARPGRARDLGRLARAGRARPCCGWPCSRPSSSRWPGCGCGPWATPWSARTAPPSPRRCTRARCRWAGSACSAR